MPNLKGLYPVTQKVAVRVYLLLEMLQQHDGECDDIILIKTNVGSFVRYVTKDCYPRGLAREHYLNSLQIQRLLSKPDTKRNGKDPETAENRMMHPRQLKAWFVP